MAASSSAIDKPASKPSHALSGSNSPPPRSQPQAPLTAKNAVARQREQHEPGHEASGMRDQGIVARRVFAESQHVQDDPPFSDIHLPELAAAKQSFALASRRQLRDKLAPGRNQRGQPSHERQRRSHQVRDAVAPGGLQLEHHLTRAVALHLLFCPAPGRVMKWRTCSSALRASSSHRTSACRLNPSMPAHGRDTVGTAKMCAGGKAQSSNQARKP
jgi:hypothetical protein